MSEFRLPVGVCGTCKHACFTKDDPSPSGVGLSPGEYEYVKCALMEQYFPDRPGQERITQFEANAPEGFLPLSEIPEELGTDDCQCPCWEAYIKYCVKHATWYEPREIDMCDKCWEDYLLKHPGADAWI